MRKILLIAMLVVGLCLSAAVVGNCAKGNLGWTDTDTVKVTGYTGSAQLTIPKRTFHFTYRIQPGEQLVVSWMIENNTYCELNVTATITGPGYLYFDLKPNKNFVMGPSTTKQVALVVGMPLWVRDYPGKQNKYYTVTVLFTSRTVARKWQTFP